MGYQIKQAAVIGSGTMGSGIAALLAGIGVEVLLLDIPAKGTQAGDPAAKRNAIAEGNVKALKKSRPPQLYTESVLEKIATGNIEDDLKKVGDADWVIEVIIENLDIKRDLMKKLIEIVKPEAIISTNTSGLPIQAIGEGLGEEFTRRFLGTHFFNPPRFLALLEVIPHENTDPELVDFIVEFATKQLGKGVVICKDEPNFIGNRFMSMVASQAMNYAFDHGYTVEEVDALTGPLIGRPKTATFNLNDLIGYDIAVHVASNLYPAIPNDPAREVLNHPKVKVLSEKMLENNWLGRKSGKGFYWMKRDEGKKELWALNLETMEYDPPSKVRFDSVGKYRKVKPTIERIKLMMDAEDRAGEFLWHHHAFYLAYASNRVPEITGTIVNIDNAQKWGFAHEFGPFEIWDAIGVEETISAFEDAGYPVADWVKKMVDDGNKTFYQLNEKEQVIGYYSPQDAAYLPLENPAIEITVADLRAESKTLAENDGGAVYDMGDGVLLWEFRSKQNTITQPFIDMGWKALEILQQDEYVALVVGNDAKRFSIGANLDPSMLMGGIEAIGGYIKNLQDLTQALRYASKPVITAPFDMALGGGNELLMSGCATVSHVELYAGLVEIGVGLVPAGGGCKELVRRVINPAAKSGPNVLQAMEKVFQAIATGKVCMSAMEAKEIGFLAETDKVVMNRAHLIGEAKQFALGLSKTYVHREPEKVWASGEAVYSALLLGLEAFRAGGWATDYDCVIGEKLAYILTGGALTEPQWVDQQLILDLELEAFLELIQQEKTQERIMHMLQTNKPLRN
jgi:3-hydroxyacyl-CoA dehydrogenase